MRFFALILALYLMPGVAAADGPLRIFVAASLGEFVKDAGNDWAGAGGDGVIVVAAGSAAIARQVAAGAEADIIWTANVEWMDWLERQNAVLPDTRRNILANRLVLIAPSDSPASEPWPEAPNPLDLSALGSDGRLAVALTDAIPAGQYAKAALVSHGAWGAVSDRLAETDNVRAALALVALGEAPMGIVYATDARASGRVSVLGQFPEESHDPITYPAAIVAGASNEDAARSFLAWLASEAGRALAIEHGFLPLPK